MADYNAGELSQRVTLRRYTEVQNEYGTLVRTAVDLATVWALVRPMSGRERDHAQQTQSRANYLVVIRSAVAENHELDEKDYVVWRGEEMNIRFVKYRPRSRYVELECERGAD